MSTTTTDNPLLAAAEAAWLEYVNGTYSEADKRVFVAAFVKGIEWQRRRVKAQQRYEDDYERRYGSRRECY